MRLSSYVIFSRSRTFDGYLAVHGYTGAVNLVSKSLYARLQAMQSDRALENPINLPSHILESMKERGFLTPLTEVSEKEYFIALAAKIQEADMASKINSFWIIPTYLCNLRCFYCFQDHKLHDGSCQAGEGSKVVGDEMIENLFPAMEKLGGAFPLGKSRKPRYITLFGGEPLMRPTERAVRQIVARAREIGYRVGAVTNGVELQYFMDLLGPQQIRWLQITIDGPKHLHDRRRRSVDSTPNFERIIENIDIALSRGVTVQVRTNVDSQLVDELATLNNLAMERGWTSNCNFKWVLMPTESHINEVSRSLEVSTIDLNSKVKELIGCRLHAPHRTEVLRQISILSKVGIHPILSPSSCGAHSRMWFFDPYGRIYTCAEQAGQPQFSVGRYDQFGVSLEAAAIAPWHSRNVGTVPECSRCAYAFFCGGGCANAAKQSHGSIFAPRCQGFQGVFDDVLSDTVIVKANIPATQSVDSECWTQEINETSKVKGGLSVEAYVDQYCAIKE